MWLFILDMVKKNYTSKSLPQSYSKEIWTCLAEQPNITLTSACDAILVGSDSYLFVYLVPVIVFIPGTAQIFLYSCKYHQPCSGSRNVKRSEETMRKTNHYHAEDCHIKY